MDDGELRGAIKYLEKLEGRFRTAPLRRAGTAGAAYAYYKNDDPALALAVAEALSVCIRLIRVWTTPIISRGWK